ncbi:MAG: LysM peptidoglycan-binding domain-containing protein [Chloracidobacterium sp.]|nr:LysM peptidoglycan-binding domain-containing protein [Chloracidobacterium sp.]
MSITCAADFADWYDGELRQYADKALTDFVHNNPGFFGVFVAGTAMSGFDAAGVFFVDLARLGAGVGEGGAKGVFQDVLRVLSVTPVGKLAKVSKPIIGRIVRAIANVFRWRKIEGGLCVPISIGQALQETGQKVLVNLDDALAGMGRTKESFDGAMAQGGKIVEIKRALNEANAVFEELPARVAQSWDDIRMFAQGTEGVIMVTLKRVLKRPTGDVHKAHMILASKTKDGVRIIDRKGIFNSLEDLSRHYGSITPAEFYKVSQSHALILVKNWVIDPALASRLNAMGPLGAVMVKVGIAFGFNPEVDVEEIKRKFRAHLAGLPPESLYPPPTRPPEMESVMFTHEVSGPAVKKEDWLSSIAYKWYGDFLLWPILWDYNKSASFTDPNKIKVGQRIKVPFITNKTANELSQYKQRGRQWK